MKTLSVELRSSKLDGNTMYGYAAVFEQVSEVAPGLFEVLSRGAFDDILADPNHDVVAVAPNHDMSRVIGRRSSGTLRLSADADGLAFEVDLPDTTYAHDLRELVSRGDIRGASFGFVPDMESVFTHRQSGRRVSRVGRVARLRDISPVAVPAYGGTSIGIRSSASSPDGRSQLIAVRARIALRKE